MKKTLAAVLAAAMALSTATVAFAKDNPNQDSVLNGSKGSDLEREIAYDDEQKLTVSQIGPFGEADLGKYYDDNYIDVTAIMTDGASKLTGRPTFNVKKVETDKGQTETEERLIWNRNIKVKDKDGKEHTVCKNGTEVKKIPVFWDSDADNWLFIEDEGGTYEQLQWLENSGDMKATYKDFKENKIGDYTTSDKGLTHEKGDVFKVVQMKFKVAHTYGTGDTTVKMKLRVTVKKDIKDEDGNVLYKKGDTYTTEEISYKAKYYELDYSKDMQITLEEVDDSKVLLKGDKLYDEIGNDTFTIAFEDTAVFEAKISSSQKKVNMFYNLDEINEVTDAYPTVDFEFITFKGNPSFVNTGTMTFNAIGGKNTTVYTFDGETLNPLTSSYDSSYGTVTVKGIKKLGTFVVASEVLEVEDEEDNEPVSSAPVVEEPSSQPSSNDSDRNPATGAC